MAADVAEEPASLRRIADAIGHELRNPLAVIGNSVYFLKMKLGDGAEPKVAKHLGIIDEEVRRADALLARILGYAKPVDADLRPRPLEPILQEFFVERPLPESIRLLREPAKTEAEIQADAAAFKKALGELVDNAVEAMPEGGTLTLSCARVGSAAELLIADSGPGLSAEARAHCFEPFFTTKTKKLGLGLALARKIIERHQGTLEWIDSPKGASFLIRLPLWMPGTEKWFNED